MIKNVIKRIFPKMDTIKNEKILKIFGPLVFQPNLWHINKKSVSRGFAIGFFCAFIPLPGQMIIAAFLSIALSANIPIAIIITWITNPMTFAPIFYITYKIGLFILNIQSSIDISTLNLNILSSLKLIWKPLLVGSFILSGISSVISYFIVIIFWKFSVKKSWLKRKKSNTK